MAINLKKLCQTMNVYTNEGWEESEDENQENREIAISVTHKLPKANPIF